MSLLGHLDNLPVRVEICQFRPGILVPRVDEPPRRGEEQDADQDDAVVIHRRRRGRIHVCCGLWSATEGTERNGAAMRTEHEHGVEEDDQGDGDGVDGEAGRAQPEGTFGHVFAAGQEVGADGEAVGDRGEDDE